MKKLLILLLVFVVSSCAELNKIATTSPLNLSNKDIGLGLREALNQGVKLQVNKLKKKDGFYKNELVKILLPNELQKVDETLRKVGLGSVADKGVLMLNRAAEDAMNETIPIFVTAIQEITFNDAKNILLGNDNAATLYLEDKTSSPLYGKINPIIAQSFSKVGADKVWKDIIKTYNKIPLTKNVNPNLSDYVTKKTIDGTFKMIALEEKEIRNNINARKTNLLKKVFKMQD